MPGCAPAFISLQRWQFSSLQLRAENTPVDSRMIGETMTSRNTNAPKGISAVLALSVALLAQAATDAPATKDPMPLFVTNSRILFTGDSITDGNRDKNDRDLNHILGHGYQAEISARFGADLYDRNLTFKNRGISGDTLRGLQGRIQKDLID